MRTVSDLQSIADVFDAFGGPSAVARALGINPSTASEMKRRGTVPSEYWVTLYEAAQGAGLPEVTYERLALIHAQAKGKLPDGANHCGGCNGRETTRESHAPQTEGARA